MTTGIFFGMMAAEYGFWPIFFGLLISQAIILLIKMRKELWEIVKHILFGIFLRRHDPVKALDKAILKLESNKTKLIDSRLLLESMAVGASDERSGKISLLVDKLKNTEKKIDDSISDMNESKK